MALFGRREVRAEKTVADRRIPQLDPGFFEEIRADLARNGGTDTIEDVAFGVANAIENVAHQLLGREPWNAKKFSREFEGHVPSDTGAADRMIDWLLRLEPGWQDTIETLLRRLREVLAKPVGA
jgi:hypothetical protein